MTLANAKIGTKRPRNPGQLDNVLKHINVDSFTKSLLSFDGPDGYTIFVDDIQNIWTPSGNTQLDTATKRFGESSVYFDGTGDNLAADGSSNFEFGNGDFTIDFWIKTLTTSPPIIYDGRLGGGGQGLRPTIYISTNLVYFTDGAVRITGTTPIVTNQWYHIALTRSGTNTRLFLNGYQEGSTYTDTNVYVIDGGRPKLGSSGADTNYFNGWIDEFRVSKGVARWTANFTPQGYPYAGSTLIPDSFTKYLLHLNDIDTSVDFLDESGHVWLANGNAQLDTAQKKFGLSSMLLDGTGDWVETRDHSDLTFGASNFTIDFWFRTTGNNMYLYGQSDSTPTSTTISVYGYVTAAGAIRASFYSGSTSYFVDSPNGFNDGNWHHYASIRNGNNLYVAVDGTLYGPTSVTGLSVNDSSQKFAIGKLGDHASNLYSGHIDEFRISNGIARWTANFTPPSSEYAP